MCPLNNSPKPTPDTLNALVDWNSPFIVDACGNILDAETGPYYPDTLTHDDDDNYALELGDAWELVTGFTGQYGYRGPVMHPSEYLGGDMAKHVLETPGLYVLLEVSDDTEDCDPVGWVLLRAK